MVHEFNGLDMLTNMHQPHVLFYFYKFDMVESFFIMPALVLCSRAL